MKTTTRRFFGLLAAIGTGLGLSTAAHADGNDTLGPPSIPIKPGTDVIAAGTGLVDQPGTISIEIPAGASIEQVLLYWGGRTGFPNVPFDLDPGPTNTITVNSLIPVTGTRINALPELPVPFGAYPASSTYRADVTALDLVTNGSNSVTIEGLDFNFHNNGASLVVIIDDGAAGALVGGVDGTDVIVTETNSKIGELLGVPQTFSFPPSIVERDARLWIIAGDGGEPYIVDGSPVERPDAISFRVGTGPEVVMPDVFVASDGLRWDTLEFLTLPDKIF